MHPRVQRLAYCFACLVLSAVRPLPAFADIPAGGTRPQQVLANAVVAATPTSTSCGSCVQVAVTITGVPVAAGFLGVRGVHVVLHLTNDLKLCTGNAADFTQGDYLQLAGGATTGLVTVVNADGSIVLDQAITGDPVPCQTKTSGTLFTLNLGTKVEAGSGTVVIDEVTVRDCKNEVIGADPGLPAAVSFATGGGSPLILTITPDPLVIWPPDRKLHDIHVNVTHTGGCEPVVVALDKITVSCLPDESHSSRKLDVVGAVRGTADFDFQLRARRCDEDHEHHGEGDEEACEDACEAAADALCAAQNDLHCDQISDRKLREECYKVQKQRREKCEKQSDHDCDEKCEQNQDLIYTIYYTATDATTLTVTASNTVRVHGDKQGHAKIAVSVGGPQNPYAAAQAPEMSVVIPSIRRSTPPKGNGTADGVDRSQSSQPSMPRLRFDGTTINPSQLFLGNSSGLVPVTGIRFADVDGDGLDDVVANLKAAESQAVEQLTVSVDDPITLFFRTFAGKSYEVSGLFGIDGRVVVAPPPPVDPSPRDDSFRSQPGAAAPIATRFGPAYPNPSHNNLSFVLELARPGEAHVEVYDLRGAKVRTLINGNQPAGRYDLSWDGRDGVGHLLPNGLYLVRMRAGTYRATRSGLLVR